jgi:hypothetical protein
MPHQTRNQSYISGMSQEPPDPRHDDAHIDDIGCDRCRWEWRAGAFLGGLASACSRLAARTLSVAANVCESGLPYGPLHPEQRRSNPTRGCELREIKPQMSFKALRSCIERNGIHRYHVTGDSASTLGGLPSNTGRRIFLQLLSPGTCIISASYEVIRT